MPDDPGRHAAHGLLENTQHEAGCALHVGPSFSWMDVSVHELVAEDRQELRAGVGGQSCGYRIGVRRHRDDAIALMRLHQQQQMQTCAGTRLRVVYELTQVELGAGEAATLGERSLEQASPARRCLRGAMSQ